MNNDYEIIKELLGNLSITELKYLISEANTVLNKKIADPNKISITVEEFKKFMEENKE